MQVPSFRGLAEFSIRVTLTKRVCMYQSLITKCTLVHMQIEKLANQRRKEAPTLRGVLGIPMLN